MSLAGATDLSEVGAENSISKAANIIDGTALRSCPKTAADWSRWRDGVLSSVDSVEDIRKRLKTFNDCDNADLRHYFEDPNFLACMSPLIRIGSLPPKVIETDLDKPAPYSELVSLPSGFFDPNLYHLLNTRKKEAEQALLEILKHYPGAYILRREKVSDDSMSGTDISTSTTTHAPFGTNYIVMIPGKEFDRALNIAVNGGVLMIGIQKKPEHQAYFTSYFPPDYVNTKANGRGVNQCATCHHTGLMPILERSDSYAKLLPVNPGDDPVATAREMNRIVARYSDAEAAGISRENIPGLGEPGPMGRSMDVIEKCANRDISDSKQRLPKSSLEKIKNKMNCSSCHNDTSWYRGTTGKLSWPWEFPGSNNLLQGIIEGGHMPPGAYNVNRSDHYLTPAERLGLEKCLLSEYFGGFKGYEGPDGTLMKYLKSPACPDSIPPKSAVQDTGSPEKRIPVTGDMTGGDDKSISPLIGVPF